MPILRLRSLYYGWVMLGTVSITEVVSWGILYYAFSVFVAPMQAELGWSRVALSGAYSLALLCSGLAAIPVGHWLDRDGPRVLMTVGSVLGSLLLVAWAEVQTLVLFYLIMAGLGMTMAAVLYEPAFALVAVWFRRQRGRALTMLTFFGAWASFLFIPLSNALVQMLGWRNALWVLAGILATLTILPHALVLRRSPQDLGLLPDGATADSGADVDRGTEEPSIPTRMALRESRFWWLSLAFAISLFATVTLTVHLIPYLVEHGHSPSFAASIAGLFGLMSLAGRLLIGPLGDRYARQYVTIGLLTMQGVGLVLLALAPGRLGALVFIVLFGAGSGTMTIMRAALLASLYGPAYYGRINGAQSLLLTCARACAPVSGGLLAGWLGGYDGMLWVLVGLVLLGILALIRLSLQEQAGHAPGQQMFP